MDSMDSITTFYDEFSNGRIKEIKVDFNLNPNLTDFSVEKYFG